MLDVIDTNIFLLINGLHSPFTDFLMYWLSNKFVWIPLYILFVYLILKHYQWKSIWVLLSFLLLIICTDQMSVHLFKNVFYRLRPCHEPSLQGLVHLVDNHCGGKYGFVSSHAANHFGLAFLLHCFLGKRISYLSVAIFGWASLVAISRVFLGVHYPADIIFGAILGCVVAWFIFLSFRIIFSLKNTKNIPL